jgi:hemolysin III
MSETEATAPDLGEEIANSITHGLGFIGSLVALPVLIVHASGGDGWHIVGVTMFGLSLLAAYGTSTLYHALYATKARKLFQILDHSAIYLLIAGSYTPFTLGLLRGPWGWSLFGVIWTLAIAGIVFKSVFGMRYPLLSTAAYVLMGWLVVVAIHPMVTRMEPAGIAWLAAGGLSYTAGVWFFAWEPIRYAHAVWHGFVIGGSVCHFVAVLNYSAAPPMEAPDRGAVELPITPPARP